jgi:hypothetical protein
MDVLATHESGNFVVFELKLARGEDKAAWTAAKAHGLDLGDVSSK